MRQKNKNLSITIEINKKEQKGSIIIKGQFNNKRILELKGKADRIIVSANIHYNRERDKFLEYIIQDNKQKKIDKLQQDRKLFPELSLLNERGMDYVFIEDMTKDESENINEIFNIQYNVANYAYYLSFKGFLLYLQNERNEPRINKVMDSLVKNQYTRRDYAFLVHPDSLDKIFGKNIRISILKLITSWFSTRIYYNGISEEELKHFVGSFYFCILHNKILEKDNLLLI